MSLTKILIDLFACLPFRGHTGPEDDIAIEVANMLKAKSLEGKLDCVWSSVSNEVGATTVGAAGFGAAKARYAKAKAMGMITGTPDYFFIWPDGGALVELKTKTGSLSPAQRLFRDWCVAMNVRHAVCRSCADVEAKLIEWRVLRA